MSSDVTRVVIDNVKTLGERVKLLRKDKGLTQSELAGLAGVTYQNIQFCESGRIKVPRYIKELADALGTSVQYLLDGELEPNVVRIQQHISLVAVDTPVTPDLKSDFYLVKIKKNDRLYLPEGATTIGKVNKIFSGHSN